MKAKPSKSRVKSRVFSQETRDKISKANKGRKRSEESKEKMRNKRFFSEKGKNGISEARLKRLGITFLNTNTGEQFLGAKAAAESIGMTRDKFSSHFLKNRINKTGFIKLEKK